MRPTSILALALLVPLLASPALGAPADDSRPTVPASEILAKIERGEPVEYYGVIVEGDLDLSKVDLKETDLFIRRVFEGGETVSLIDDKTQYFKLVESRINITNSEIQGDVRFDGVLLQKDVCFKYTNFTKNVSFLEANFSCCADFERAVFSDDANFRGAKFSDFSDFGGAEFSSNANYKHAVFNNIAVFGTAVFNGDANFGSAVFSVVYANFSETVFNGAAYFWGAEFYGESDFRGAVFSGKGILGLCADFMDTNFIGPIAYFYRANFSGDSNFMGAVFSGDAIFLEANFGGKSNFLADFGGDASFGRCKFSGDADFRGACFSDDVSFEDSSFDRANLMLEDAREIRILRLSNSTFENESTISLKGTDYDRLYVHWDQIKDGFVYNGEAYLTLIKNFRNIEYFEDADDCYYQYRRERQSMRSWLEVAKYTDILGWVTCGYGVRPGYTLVLGLFVVLVSAVYYWRRDAIRRLKGDEDESAKFSDAFYFSMMTFTTVGYGDWYPLDRHRKVVMIEGIFGWLTLSLFLVTLANVIIR